MSVNYIKQYIPLINENSEQLVMLQIKMDKSNISQFLEVLKKKYEIREGFATNELASKKDMCNHLQIPGQKLSIDSRHGRWELVHTPIIISVIETLMTSATLNFNDLYEYFKLYQSYKQINNKELAFARKYTQYFPLSDDELQDVLWTIFQNISLISIKTLAIDANVSAIAPGMRNEELLIMATGNGKTLINLCPEFDITIDTIDPILTLNN